MLPLAHMGITLAIARGLEKAMVCQGISKFSNVIDYRIVLFGSMLPDIIDKPFGGLILKETLGNGRVYCHTLIFLLILFSVAFLFWFKLKRPGFLVLAGGCLVHYILDSMWLNPQTLLWPMYGWSFPKGEPDYWMQLWLTNLLNDPYVYVPEIIGGLYIACFVVDLILRKSMKEFIITGKLARVTVKT